MRGCCRSRRWPTPDPAFAMRGVNADKAALKRVGEIVRRRLGSDPSVHKVPAQGAEIFAVGAFLQPSECARLMTMIDDVARPSSVFEPEKGGKKYRTSYSGDVDPREPFVRMIERRLCDLLGLDIAWGETVQGQRYAPGQEFRAHYDWFDTDAGWWPAESKRGGQRSFTAMAYLNDVEEGGETVFDRLGGSIAPQAGALLVWNNARPDGLPNIEVRHAGAPVVRGTKYVITKWFRTRRWS